VDTVNLNANVHNSQVPEERPKIARRFNAGNRCPKRAPVP
jgi:hypothetical protein